MKRTYLAIAYTALFALLCLAVAVLNLDVLSDRHSDLTTNDGIGQIAPPAPTGDEVAPLTTKLESPSAMATEISGD